MSTSDQLMLARISGICSRHCARGQVNDLDAAVAELRAVAGDRHDLLAKHASLALGIAEAGASLAPRCRVEAELCIAAGADKSARPKWMEVGRKRAEQARLTPYAGLPSR